MVTHSACIRGERLASVMLESASMPVGTRINARSLRGLVPSAALRQLLMGPTLLVFVSSSCRDCVATVVELNQIRPDSFGFRVVVVEAADPDGHSLEESAQLQCEWLVDRRRHLFGVFGVQFLPTMFVVEKGRVTASTWQHGVLDLLTRASVTVPLVAFDR